MNRKNLGHPLGLSLLSALTFLAATQPVRVQAQNLILPYKGTVNTVDPVNAFEINDTGTGTAILGRVQVKNAAAIYGRNNATNDFGYLAGNGYGVRGYSASGAGVSGQTDNGDGVEGWSQSGNAGYFQTNGTGSGVVAIAVGQGGIGLTARNQNGGLSAFFGGGVQINGNLQLNGDLHYNNAYRNSDVRFKNNIVALHDALGKVLAINGYSFTLRQGEFPDMGFDSGRHIGLLAQEVKRVFPELVHQDKKGFLSVDYPALVAPMIEAVKQENARIDQQQQQIADMKAEIAAIKAQHTSSAVAGSVMLGASMLCGLPLLRRRR